MNWQSLQSWLVKLHPDTWSGAFALAILFWVGGLLLSWTLHRAIWLVIERDRDQRIDRMAARFLSKVASVFVWLIIMMLYAHMIPALDRLSTALLASVSVASIVIGLAAQSTLANFVSGLSLIFYRPFRLGDRIQINAPTGLETGVVEDVSLGYTILQTFDNRRVIISNSVISNTVMVNLTAVHPRVMAIVPFSIGYDADIDKARTLALELAEAHPQVEEVAGCPVVLLGPSSVDLTLRVWCPDPVIGAGVKYDLTEAIKKRFDTEDIEIPFAYQNVVVKSLPTSAPARKPEQKDKDC
ncbi:Small-conductance mechanosensitive channel [Sulfitobacter pontiacus]|uniref:Small-conductance mechanosensitive channel n=1 Tax=Sulfitobacter pontiacus TaxID=60137 RepID=A0AAX3A9U4_9RHOB|nr:mechanosensitive ion channel family protein [Sulfitobacter pontiacus]UOA23027.1 Small-conductance mechanosensitive channel [Sulfitobacter pontiacus]|tara:strand:- start:338 stop:1231 length:894 start_codon:yes stop_codon:yes gene_type:complete